MAKSSAFAFLFIISFAISKMGSSASSSQLSSLKKIEESEYRKLSAIDISTILKHGHLRETFQSWIKEFKKEYPDTPEELRRFAIWLRNHEHIEKHNNQYPPPSFELGHNHFSDLTNEEFQKLNFLGEHSPGIPPRTITKSHSTNDDHGDETFTITDERERVLFDLPPEVDWVKEGAVTPVQNQGKCGSCWAFSAIGAIESAKFIKDGELVELSKQMMIDCDSDDNGCEGGLMDTAFQFTRGSGGLCTEAEYPYKAMKADSCRASSCQKVVDSKVIKYINVKEGSEENLLVSLAQQPVSVGIQANQIQLQLYKGGVFDWDECGDDLDHGVLVVGYGTDDETGKPYWKVKNSWGDKWGEDGYIRIDRTSSHENGICGILSMPSRPLV